MKEKYEAAYSRMEKRLQRTPGPLETDCMIWLGAVDQNGHGNVFVRMTGSRKTRDRKAITDKAHRIAYIAFCGPIPDGKVVRHRCDVRRCCNIAHLELGTQLENVRDMYARGRAANQYGPHSRNQEESSTSLADALAFA
jgi:hypothetical protein